VGFRISLALAVRVCQDLSHALDLLMKFQKNEWYIKSAFFEDETGKNKKLPSLPV
jgi:hypothetical protein